MSVEAEKQCDEPDYGDSDREDEGRCKHEGPDARITRDGSSGATSPSFDRVRPRAPRCILLELPDDIPLTVSLLRHSRSVGLPFAPLAGVDRPADLNRWVAPGLEPQSGLLAHVRSRIVTGVTRPSSSRQFRVDDGRLPGTARVPRLTAAERVGQLVDPSTCPRLIASDVGRSVRNPEGVAVASTGAGRGRAPCRPGPGRRSPRIPTGRGPASRRRRRARSRRSRLRTRRCCRR